MQLDVQMPAKLAPLFKPCRYKIMHGGRGGGKSVSVALALLTMGMERRLRILCTREIQKSLKESVLKLLGDLIAEHGLEGFYDVQATTIKGINGTEFLFAGLQDHTVDSIKSYANVDIAWVEEAHSVSARSWQVLTPTIRKDGSEIWATFNPDSAEDEVYKRFVKQGDPQAWVCEINWRDNPWFPQVLEDERRQLKAINDDLYQHVWEGKCRSVAGLLFKRHHFKRFNLGEQPTRLNHYLSSDYAGGPDPDDPDADPNWTEHGLWGMDESGDLWAVDWWSGQEDPHVWIQAWLAMCRRHKPLTAFEEKGVILRSVDAAIRKAMREAGTFVHREPLVAAGSKSDRALGFLARAAAGTVHIPNTEWGDALIEQLCAFNGQDGRRDDKVDVCSLLARGLDHTANARPEPKTERPAPPAFGTEAWMNARELAEQRDREANKSYYR